MFRGRELSHPELGRAVLDKVAEQLRDIVIVERIPKLEGKNMTMVLSPRPQKSTKKKDQPEVSQENPTAESQVVESTEINESKEE